MNGMNSCLTRMLPQIIFDWFRNMLLDNSLIIQVWNFFLSIFYLSSYHWEEISVEPEKNISLKQPIVSSLQRNVKLAKQVYFPGENQMSGIYTWLSVSSFSSVAGQGKRIRACVMRERTICILFSIPDGIKYHYLAVVYI